MKKILSFKESCKRFHRNNSDLSYFLTSLYAITIFAIGLDKVDSFMDFWRSWTKDYMGLFLILIINVILYTVNYIVSVMGTYLLTTSFQLSGKYGRFLIVILGIGFSLSILHILPNTEITETYNSWFTYFCLRVIQGVGVVSMMVLVWGLIQGLVLYIIGNDGDS
ncbi:hypothetical protein G6699_07300 [Polynucleobacter paneuropaeus]|nr:hypothetical protein [Polynucleobacter paneuropaeus]